MDIIIDTVMVAVVVVLQLLPLFNIFVDMDDDDDYSRETYLVGRRTDHDAIVLPCTCSALPWLSARGPHMLPFH
jgi:hypothetical protein